MSIEGEKTISPFLFYAKILNLNKIKYNLL